MQNRPYIGFVMSLLPLLFLAGFVGVPLIMSLLYSLGDLSGADTSIRITGLHQIQAKHGLTLSVYRQLLSERSFIQDIWITIWVTAVSVVLVLMIGWAIAMYTRLSKGPAAKVLSVLYVVPMFIPTVIASYAIVSFYNDGGFLSSVLTVLGVNNPQMPSYTAAGIVVAQVWSNIPFAALMLSSGLKAIPDSHIESARDIGASWPSIILRVLLPQNSLSTVIVTTFTIIGIMGSFTVPYLTGPNAPQMLGVAMYSYFSNFNQPQQAQAMAIILFLLSLVVAYFYVRSNVEADKKGGVLR